MSKLFPACLVLCIVTSTAVIAQTTTNQEGAVPTLVRFSSRLAGMNNSTVRVHFVLYPEQFGGLQLWSETHDVTTDAEGKYTVLLGSNSTAGMPLAAFRDNSPRWLSVQRDGSPEEPRVLLVSVPYALKAGDADLIGGHPVTDFVLRSALSEVNLATKQAEASLAQPEPSVAVNTTTGTANFVSKFLDASGNIGNSLLFDNGASMGIGTTTPDLAVQGNRTLTLFSPTQASGMEFGSGTNTNTGQVGVFAFVATNSSSTGSNRRVAFFDALLNTTDPSYGGTLRFGTKPPGGSLTTRMVIGSTGNVGIANAVPAFPLDVAGIIHSSTGGFRFPDGSTQTSAATSTGFVDLTTAQSIDGTKTFTSTVNASISGTAGNVTGVVAVLNGGTGITSSGSAGNFLRSNGAGWTSSAIQPADISGFQHMRIDSGSLCTTVATAGQSCVTGAVAWPVAFADTNYTVSCTGRLGAGRASLSVNSTSAASITLIITALTNNAASFAGVDCIAVHD
jgi:trimeric autotransporter adhesin